MRFLTQGWSWLCMPSPAREREGTPESLYASRGKTGRGVVSVRFRFPTPRVQLFRNTNIPSLDYNIPFFPLHVPSPHCSTFPLYNNSSPTCIRPAATHPVSRIALCVFLSLIMRDEKDGYGVLSSQLGGETGRLQKEVEMNLKEKGRRLH